MPTLFTGGETEARDSRNGSNAQAQRLQGAHGALRQVLWGKAPLTRGEGFQSLAVGRFVWPLMTDMTAVHEGPRCRKLRTGLRVVPKQNLRCGYICVLFWVTGCRLLSVTEEG